jgi:hypothetical protein
LWSGFTNANNKKRTTASEPHRPPHHLYHELINVIWVRAKGQRSLDKSGRPERFPGAIIDITATRRAG